MISEMTSTNFGLPKPRGKTRNPRKPRKPLGPLVVAVYRLHIELITKG